MLKRLLFFAYGSFSYLIFLATFLYAIAFVGGFVVPTQLDGPSQEPVTTALAIDAALLTVFAVQHSVMASSARPSSSARARRFYCYSGNGARSGFRSGRSRTATHV